MKRIRQTREQAAADLIAQAQLRLQAMMIERGWKQAQLADAMGVSVARVSQMLGHKANPTLDTVAVAFHVMGDVASVNSDGNERRAARLMHQGRLPDFVASERLPDFSQQDVRKLTECLSGGPATASKTQPEPEAGSAGSLALAA